ncbi:MAG: site-specific integrase [Gammaproteobacteria bacterium]|nr:site-specific integrase [Gammaproteobacteria bacterium]
MRTQLLPTFGARPLDRIDPVAVHGWFDGYSRVAPGGANRTLDVLRQILNTAVAYGYLDINPTRSVRRNPRPTRFLSRAEVDRLNAALDAHRGRGSGGQQAAIIRLLLLTGCRKGELVHLRWSEVDGNTLRLTDSKTGPRTVMLSTQALAILARQPRTRSPYVFPSLGDSSKPRSTELSLWRKVRRQAGIEDVRLHDLRHTFASHAVMRSVPLPVVSRLLGHSRARMTLRYAHVSDRETEAAAERVGAPSRRCSRKQLLRNRRLNRRTVIE